MIRQKTILFFWAIGFGLIVLIARTSGYARIPFVSAQVIIPAGDTLASGTAGERLTVVTHRNPSYGIPCNLSVEQSGVAEEVPIAISVAGYPEISHRSAVNWLLTETGDITADLVFEYESLIEAGLEPGLVVVIKEDAGTPGKWSVVKESHRDDRNKMITINEVTEFGKYSVGFCKQMTYCYQLQPRNADQYVNPFQPALIWASDSFERFDVYVGTDNPPSELWLEKTASHYTVLDTLAYNTRYYWRIVAWKGTEKHITPVWSFVTCTEAQRLVNYAPGAKKMQIHYNDQDGPYEISTYTVIAKSANTGVTYDSKRHLLVHCDGFGNKLIFRTRKNESVAILRTGAYITLLQGLTYVPDEDVYWVWGCPAGKTCGIGKEDPENPGYSFHKYMKITADGQVLDEKPTLLEDSYPGMISYDITQNSIWSKANNEWNYGKEVKNLSLPEWTTSDSFAVPVGGEGIAWSPFDQSIWLHDGINVYQYSKHHQPIGNWPSPVDKKQAEGLVIDPTDNTLWLSADEYYHGEIPDGNRVWHLDPLHTYNKDVFFPNMFHWSTGKIVENLILEGDTLYVDKGFRQGRWISPVINFQAYRPDIDKIILSNDKNTAIKIRYRGSATAPDVTSNNQFALKYYEATLAGDGWGTVIPSEWNDELPPLKYIQIEVEIAYKNQIPVAFDDYFAVDEDKLLQVDSIKGALRNDVDKDAFPADLTCSLSRTTSNGSLAFLPSGAFTYTPSPDFCGTDTFEYCVFDGRDYSPAARVIVRVNPVNDTPVIIGQAALTCPEDQSLKINLSDLLIADPDNTDSNDFVLQLFDREHYALAGNTIMPEKNFFGTLYVPVVVANTVPEAEWSEVFTLEIVVNPVNDPPIIAGQTSISLTEDSPWILKETAILFSDPDTHPDSVSFSMLPGENYSLCADTLVPAPDYYGSLQVPVIANDQSKEYAVSQPYILTVNVLPVNDPPVVSGQKLLTTTEDTPLQLKPGDFFYHDTDNADSWPFSLITAPGDNYSVGPNNTIIPLPDYFGMLWVPIQISDNLTGGLSRIFTANIEVAAQNDPPRILSPSQLSIYEDDTLCLPLSTLAADVDNLPADLHFSISPNAQIGLSIANDSAYFFPLIPHWNGQSNISLHVSDSESSTGKTVSVVVIAQNDPPVLIADTLFCKEDLSCFMADNALVFDPDNPVSDISVLVPSGSEITARKVNGGYTFSTKTKNFYGSVNCQIRIKDRLAETISDLFVVIEPQNDAPIILAQAELSVDEDSFILLNKEHFTITDVDNDLEELHLQIISGNGFIHSGDTVFPPENYCGQLVVPLVANDCQAINNLSEVYYAVIGVQAVNDPPVIDSTANVQIYEDETLTNLDQYVFVTDIDNPSHDIKIAVLAGNNYTTNGSDIVPQVNFTGILWVNLLANDRSSSAKSDTAVMRVTVLPVNDPPVIVGALVGTFIEDQLFTIDLAQISYTDPDPVEGRVPTVVVLPGEHYTVNGNTIAPEPNYFGTVQIRLILDDGCPENNLSPEFLIETYISAVNDPPVLTLPDTITFYRNFVSSPLHIPSFSLDPDNSPDELILSWLPATNIQIIQIESELIFFANLPEWIGQENITFDLSDGHNSVSQVVVVQCLNSEGLPIITGQRTLRCPEDSSIVISLNDLFVTCSDTMYPDDYELIPSSGLHYLIEGNRIIPHSDYFGSIIVPVRIVKNTGEGIVSNQYPLNISVTNTNDPPSLLAKTCSGTEGMPLTIGLADITFDRDNSLSDLLFDVASDSHITCRIEGTSLIVTPLDPDFYGNSEFYLTVSDPDYSFSRAYTVEFVPVNDAPKILQTEYTGTEDQSLSVELTKLAVDIDTPFDSLQFEVHGTHLINASIQGPDLVLTPVVENWNGVCTVQLSVSDSAHTTNGTLKVTVGAVNDSPSLSLPDSVVLYEDAALTFNMAPFCTDVDNPLNRLSLTWQSNPNIVFSELNKVGTFRPAKSNWHGRETLIFSLSDGEYASTDTLLVVCLPVSDQILYNLPLEISYPEDGSIELNVNNYITTTDFDDYPIHITIAGNSKVHVANQDNVLTFSSKAPNWFGSEYLTLFFSYGNFIDSKGLSVVCLPINDPPASRFPDTFFLAEDDTLRVDMGLYLSDIDNHVNELQVSAQVNPRLSMVQQGNILSILTNQRNWFGSERLVFQVSDKDAGIYDTVIVAVLPVVDRPISVFPDTLYIPEDEEYSIPWRDFVLDFDSLPDQIRIDFFGSDSTSAMVTDSNVTFRSEYKDWYGKEYIHVHISNSLYSSLDSICLVVFPVNDIPVINQVLPENHDLTVYKNATLYFARSIIDVDNDTESFWLVNEEKKQKSADSLFVNFPELGSYEIVLVASDQDYEVMRVWDVHVVLPPQENEITAIRATRLFQNTPNPFSEETTIEFVLKGEEVVNLYIYNSRGDLIKQLIKNQVLGQGLHSARWNGTDSDGILMKPGVFFYRLTTSDTNTIMKGIRIE